MKPKLKTTSYDMTDDLSMVIKCGTIPQATMQETFIRLRYMRKILADLAILLDSCLRDCARNPL